jgi:uncharacterized protein DUF2630
MDDIDIAKRIKELADEEHHLFTRAAEDQSMTDDERARLDRIEVGLDQCWDLLRQRRARRAAGQDPDAASVRDPDTVERYLS